MAKNILLILCVVMASWTGSGFADAQNLVNSPELEHIVSGPDLENVTVEEAVAHILVSNHLVGGMALLFDCSSAVDPGTTKHFFNLSGLTVRQALDEIIRNDQRYQWKEFNQAIILFPRIGMPELLNTRVDHLEIDNPRYMLSAASGSLLQLPEIKKRKEELKLKEGRQMFIGGIDPQQVLKSKVLVTHVSMYEALNAIGQVNGSVVWRYAESHCNGERLVNVSWVSR